MSLLEDNIAGWGEAPLAEFSDRAPWELTTNSSAIVERLITGLGDDYRRSGDIAVHRTSIVESGALLKGPLVINANCFIAQGSLIRGGCWVDEDCIIGPGAELKSSFVFRGSKLAHFNFVGDSVLGARVNLEAGSIIANYRNELADPEIVFMHDGVLIETRPQVRGVGRRRRSRRSERSGRSRSDPAAEDGGQAAGPSRPKAGKVRLGSPSAGRSRSDATGSGKHAFRECGAEVIDEGARLGARQPT